MTAALDRAAIGYDTPALTCDEGLPLANGLMGALLWGDGAPLTISLDRTDLWDLRPVPEFSGPGYTWERVAKMHRAGEHDALAAMLEAPYQRPAPTKIPAGRIELLMTGSFDRATLDLAEAVATVSVGGRTVRVRVDAEQRTGVIDGQSSLRARLVAPEFGASVDEAPLPPVFDGSVGSVCDLDYPPPEWHHEPGVDAFSQAGWGGFIFSVALVTLGARAAWSIATNVDHPDPMVHAITTARTVLADTEAYAAHRRWWNEYWDQTSVSVPDGLLSDAYHRDLYKFGAAARRGAPPVALQGPWTIDNGRLPPWKGDYHHDLNTQLTYWPAYSGNRLEAGLGFLDWLWSTREACREWTCAFYGVPGLNVPMTADLANRQIGGWRQYTHSVSTSAWLAHHFWLHWRYSDDEAFLAARAYPWVSEVAEFIEAVSANRDRGGRRSVALSSSPEINDNRPEAWFDTMTNYDCACFQMALHAAASMGEALGKMEDATRWRAVAAGLPDLAIDIPHGLLIAPGVPLPATHRHFSHLLALHPFGLIDPRRSAIEAETARRSIADIVCKGTGLWMGYSFAAWAALLARAGDGDAARDALHAYIDGFLLKNSFHANGDFANKGYSGAVFRAFTLEGNFAAVAAVHEMLLQSHNELLHLFPAVPGDWTKVGFDRLLAEGALTVSARRVRGGLVDVKLTSARARSVTLLYARSPAALTIELTPDIERVLSSAELDYLNEKE